jgi:molybdopterin converting factor subunit 1
MKLSVLFFAAARDAIGQASLEVELPDNQASVGDLKRELAASYPNLKSLQHLLVAVNNDYVPDDHELSAGDEVACFPPVSGG